MLLRIFVDNMNYFNHGIYHKILYLIYVVLFGTVGGMSIGGEKIFSERLHPLFCLLCIILQKAAQGIRRRTV